jgi:acyl carrier protein
MSERLTILGEIRAVAAEQDKTLAPLTDELPLLDSGLDSLCFVILVGRLEDITGHDPFATSGASRYPKTLGDLIAFYDQALV